MNKVKAAVIGCGSIAKNAHVPAYIADKDSSEVKYFIDIIPERAQAMAKMYGSGECLTGYRKLLSDKELDLVSICTPNYLHAPMAIDLLNAGINVLCEKPASTDWELVNSMKIAADKSGKLLNIGVCNRYSTAVNHIKKLIDNNELGEVYHVNCSFREHRSIPGLGGAFTTKSLSGGGVLIDWGVHLLDIIFYCLSNASPKSVSSVMYSKLGSDIANYAYVGMWAGPPDLNGTYDVEEYVGGLIRSEGTNICFNGAWAQNIAESGMFIEFLGDKAGIKFDYNMGNYIIYSAKDGVLYESKPIYSSKNMYEEEVRDFVQAVKENSKTRNNIDYCLTTAKVMDAIYKSAESGGEVAI